MSNEKEMSLQYDSLSEGLHQKHKVMSPTGKCTQVGILENVHSTWEKHEILMCRNEEWRQPNVALTSNDARLITLKLNPSLRPVLPAPHGKGHKCEFTMNVL